MTRLGGEWRNWARTASVRPQRVERPRSTAAVQRAVQSAAGRGLRVKAVGTGHSFNGIAVAPGVLLDFSDLSGLIEVDRERATARLWAGTRIADVPGLLAPYGLAMENLGDIDRQTLAGAVSTGTHGTGAGFGGLATQLVAVTLVTADGELRVAGEGGDSGLLPAVAVSLGALGVIVDVTLQCVPAFVLECAERVEPLDAVLDDLDRRVAESDHFEFFWFPHTDVALTKTLTRRPESTVRRPLPRVRSWLEDGLLSNGVYRAGCAAAAAVPALAPVLTRTATRVTGSRDFSDVSARVFASRREVRFREMEYALPAEAVADAFRGVREEMSSGRWRLSFPVEVRFGAADDLWLSPAHGRPSGYIAVHRYWREDPSALFRETERVFRAHDGRPHWGKMHTLTADDLAGLYPRFADFLALRERYDPERRFANAHLERVLGA